MLWIFLFLSFFSNQHYTKASALYSQRSVKLLPRWFHTASAASSSRRQPIKRRCSSFDDATPMSNPIFQSIVSCLIMQPWQVSSNLNNVSNFILNVNRPISYEIHYNKEYRRRVLRQIVLQRLMIFRELLQCEKRWIELLYYWQEKSASICRQ